MAYRYNILNAFYMALVCNLIIMAVKFALIIYVVHSLKTPKGNLVLGLHFLNLSNLYFIFSWQILYLNRCLHNHLEEILLHLIHPIN